MCNFVSYFVFILDCDLLHSKTCFGVTEIGTPVSEESPLYEYAVFSKNNSQDDYYCFRTKRGRLLEGRRLFTGGDNFKFCSLEVAGSCP